MTDIEKKAEALVNEVIGEGGFSPQLTIYRSTATFKALCRAIEQHEAFRQEVSDAVEDYKADQPHIWDHSARCFAQFIIPKPKPDPLVEVLDKMLRRRFLDPLPDVLADEAHWLRDTLDALGFEIREKNDEN